MATQGLNINNSMIGGSNTLSPIPRPSSSSTNPSTTPDIPLTPDTVVGTGTFTEKAPAAGESSILDKDAHDRKMLGYSFYSRFIAEEPTLFMVRRFGALNVRAALALQDEIVQLEDELNYEEYYNRDILEGEYDNGSFRLDPDKDRKKLIEDQIIPKLTRYSMSC